MKLGSLRGHRLLIIFLYNSPPREEGLGEVIVENEKLYCLTPTLSVIGEGN